MLSVIIPASNEAEWIGDCLAALLASDPVPGGAEVIVVANGCRDDTALRAQAFAETAARVGWGLNVLDLKEGGKPGALNRGDHEAQGDMRAYLDADVQVSPAVMAQIAVALSTPEPRYASGRPRIPPPRSLFSRIYARFWQRLPFVQSAAPGYGLFAVNRAGRARWGLFPGIISDDTFVRLQFQPRERIEVRAGYNWPMIEGFLALVRVRRRQDAGVAEIARLYPDLPPREGKARLGLAGYLRLALADPLGFAAYAAVILSVRLGRGDKGGWARGR